MDYHGLEQALKQESPLQIAGTINAYSALLAKKAGFKAIYLSGAGVANASHGMPDLGMTNLNDVAEDARRITDCCDLPLLVDIDTGWGSAFNIQRSIKTMIKSGVAAVHIEDQIQAKRCGHRPGKAIVESGEMCDRIKAAVDARTQKDFTIMARTDSLAIEGLEASIERVLDYIEAGADMIFFEGANSIEQYQAICTVSSKPVLANMTEFGVSPLCNKDELAKAGIQLILYPLSAFRMMSAAAMNCYQHIKQLGNQSDLLEQMQTRQELYDILDYHQYEERLDKIIAKEK